MKRLLEAVKRMFTLPRAYNSVKDVIEDPVGAVRYCITVLEKTEGILRLLGERKKADRLSELIEGLKGFLLYMENG